MSLEWVSWLFWSCVSLCNSIWPDVNVAFLVLAFGSATFVVMCSYGSGIAAEQLHENK